VAYNRKKKDKSTSKGWRSYIPFIRRKAKKEAPAITDPLVVGKDFDKNQTILITEDNIGQYLFPACCHPIPGDGILGYINANKQVEIHSRSCQEAARLQSSFGTQILAAKWDMRGDMTFTTFTQLIGIDRKGLLKDVSAVLSDSFDINIKQLTIKTDDGIFKADIEFQVRDIKDLERVMAHLQKIDGLQSVHRS
jgi:GTP pyrophosphokinase